MPKEATMFEAVTPSGAKLVMRELSPTESQEIGIAVARSVLARDGDQVEIFTGERCESLTRSLVQYGDKRVSDSVLPEELYHAMSPRDMAAAELMWSRMHELDDIESKAFFATMKPVTGGGKTTR